ncbi:hypothetical protein [Streptomyces sp. NPDC060194]|uniref:hypothetical protein n=1 Tax=Streptomyces sp. NPDC060194 TaxID=3347069 RepID=UPI003668A455
MLAVAVCFGVATASPAAAESHAGASPTGATAAAADPLAPDTATSSEADGPAWYGWELRLTDDSIVTSETRSGFEGDTAYFSTEEWTLGPQGISARHVASHS